MPKVLLAPHAAEVFALSTHELATNALERSALTTPGGRIAVTWNQEPGGAAPLLSPAWTKTGMHDLAPAPRRRGFGTETLKHMLRYEFGAETVPAYAPGGLRCTNRFALPPEVGSGIRAAPYADGTEA